MKGGMGFAMQSLGADMAVMEIDTVHPSSAFRILNNFINKKVIQ